MFVSVCVSCVVTTGLSRADASLMEGNISSWMEMLGTNVMGTAMVTRAIIGDMKRRSQWGHVINMVGLSGHRIPDGPQGGGFYCATKAAVKMMTEGLRQEARGANLPLRVTGISPGIVETEFFQVSVHMKHADSASLSCVCVCVCVCASLCMCVTPCMAPYSSPTGSPALASATSNLGCICSHMFVVHVHVLQVRHKGDTEAARRATSAFPCLQPSDVASAILWALSVPDNMEVNDIVIRPTSQLI